MAGKGCLSDFAVRGSRSVDAEFGESFSCFYCAQEQVFSDPQKCVKLCIHKDYSSL